MYSIKIKAESGADLRKQLLALLGDSGVTMTLEAQPLQIVGVNESTKEVVEEPEQNRPETEAPKRIRRTKEQIAADQALEKEEIKETAQNLEHSESPNLEVKEESENVFAKKLKQMDEGKKEASSSLSQQDLVNKAIQLGAGRKEEIRAILKDYGVEKIPSLEQKDYAGFMGKLEELENLVEA